MTLIIVQFDGVVSPQVASSAFRDGVGERTVETGCAPAPITTTPTSCPFCHKRLLQRELADHYRKEHKHCLSSTTEPESRAMFGGEEHASAPRSSRGLGGHSRRKSKWSYCPQCNCRIKPARLQGHLQRVHPAKGKSGVSSKGSVPIPVSPKRDKSTRSRKLITSENDAHLDASLGNGHVWREASGQYGSYPSHDDYSETSVP